MKSYATIGEYIKEFPNEVKSVLENIRKTINSIVPDGEEAIRYGIPTIRLHGINLVHFAAYNNHIGFYPTSSGIRAFIKKT